MITRGNLQVDYVSELAAYVDDSGAADAYAVTIAPAILVYTDGLKVRFKAANTNTGASTIAVNGLSTKTIKKNVSSDLSEGDITVGKIIELIYDGTNFQITSSSTIGVEFASRWYPENWDLSRSLGLEYRQENRQSITLAAGEDELHGFIYAKGKLWASDMAFPNYLYRFNDPNDLTDYDKVQIGTSGGDWGNGYDVLYVPEKNKIYTVTNDTGSTGFAEIYSIDPDATSMTKTLVLSYDTSFWFIQSLASDGTYLYALVGDGTIIKIDLSDNTYVTSVVSSTSNAHTIRYDGTYLYVTSVNIARIARIDPVTLTVLQNTLLQAGQGITDDFCFAGDYIWLGLEALTGSILKVKKTDFTFTTINVGLLTQCYGTYFDGWYVWAVYNTSPGTLVRIDPETHEIYKKVLEAGENASNEIISDGQRLFITCFLSPAKMIRMSVPQMTFVSAPTGFDTNFATTDLTFTGNRTHDAGGLYALSLTNFDNFFFQATEIFLNADAGDVVINMFSGGALALAADNNTTVTTPSFRIVDDSLPGASVGYVWTLANTGTADGRWAAATGAAADNGTHLDTGVVYLGGTLLENTDVNGNENAYDMTFTAIDQFQVTAIGILFTTGSNGSTEVSGKFGFINPLTTATLTGDANDYAPINQLGSTVWRVSSDASRNITGIDATGTSVGRTIYLVNVGSQNIVLKNADAGSSAVNRFALNADITLAANQGVQLWYDGTSTRWRTIGR